MHESLPCGRVLTWVRMCVFFLLPSHTRSLGSQNGERILKEKKSTSEIRGNREAAVLTYLPTCFPTHSLAYTHACQGADRGGKAEEETKNEIKGKRNKERRTKCEVVEERRRGKTQKTTRQIERRAETTFINHERDERGELF